MFNAWLVTPDGLIDPNTDEIPSDDDEHETMKYESESLTRDIPSVRAFFNANPKISQNTEAKLDWPPIGSRGDNSNDSNDEGDKDANEDTDGTGNDGESNGVDDNSSSNE